MAKKALGKGLGALIRRPSASTSEDAGTTEDSTSGSRRQERPQFLGDPVVPGERVRLIPVDEITPSPLQPRKAIREDELEELKESLRQHGVIQPLIVRNVSGTMELVAGERRWRAAEKLGMAEVPVIVREASDRDVLEMALIENIQRADLNPVEEAEAYVRLAKEFDMRQEDIATRVGKNRATVANSMRLLDLEDEVRNLLSQGRISTGHAKVLLGEKEPERQRLLAEQVVKKGLTVRATEQLLAATSGGKRRASGSRSTKNLDPTVAAAVEDLTDRLRERMGTRVAIHHGEKKGRIEIEYYGNEDLDRVLGLMGVSMASDF